MILLHIMILCCTTGLISPTNLKSGFGVNFEHAGQIHPALERQFLALDIALPQYTSYFRPDDYKVKCFSDENGFDRDSCDVFRTLMQQHATTVKLEEDIVKKRIDNIIKALPQGQTQEIRKKRGIGMLVFGIASGLASAVNSILMRRQIGAMQETVDILENKQFELENRFMELSDDVIAIAQITSEHFNELTGMVNRTNQALIILAREINMRMAPLIASIEAKVKYLEQNLQIIARRTAKSQFQMQITAKHFNSMEWYLNNYETGIIDLMQGKLPTALIQPTDLMDILNKARKQLKQTHPAYELVFPMVAHYYRKTDILYTIENNHLVVIVPLFLKKRNQEPMDLYAISTCYVPFHISNKTSAETSHTKVMIEPAYIAVKRQNFAEISNTQLDSCTNYNGLYLCEHYILQVFQSSLTCASAIFWDSQPSVINTHCEFKYYHKLQTPPCILESDTHVLLTNLGTKWQFRCNDQNVPVRVKGSNFAVIPNSVFCGCALIGHTYFIPQRLKDCKNKPEHIRLYYPVNAAVLSVFNANIQEGKLLANLSEIYIAPQDLKLPTLDLEISKANDDILADNNLKQEIDLKRVASAMKQRKHMYLDREEKQLHNSKLENWFLNLDNIAIGITFILSLIGTLAAIVGIVNCVKNYKVMALYGYLMSKPADVHADSGCHTGTMQDAIVARTYQIIIVATLILLYKLAKLAYNRLAIIKILRPKSISTYTGLQSHIRIELGNAQMGMTSIYVCSLSATVADLKLVGTPRLMNFQIHLSKFRTHGIMAIDWATEIFNITCDGITLTMPTVAYVSLWKYYKVAQIKKQSYVVRILITYDGVNYLLNEDKTFVMPPHPNDTRDEPLSIDHITPHQTSSA